MPRRHDERQVVGVDHRGRDPGILRVVADDAQLEVPVDDLRRHAARQAAPHLHVHSRVEPAVGGDVRQEVERRRLVGADREAAGRVVAQLRERVVHLRPQVVEPARVVEHEAAGVGEKQLLARPVDQALAQLRLEPLDRERHGRLRAKQLLRGAREAALGRHGPEHLQRIPLHPSSTARCRTVQSARVQRVQGAKGKCPLLTRHVSTATGETPVLLPAPHCPLLMY